jgi:hypothetical protein
MTQIKTLKLLKQNRPNATRNPLATRAAAMG